MVENLIAYRCRFLSGDLYICRLIGIGEGTTMGFNLRVSGLGKADSEYALRELSS